jgi:hypothetical protein
MRAIILAVLILVATCIEALAGSLTIALVDMSGSVTKDNEGQESKDSPLNRNLAELNKEIHRLGKGNTIICIGFGRKSDVTFLKATMPKQAGPMNKYLNATRDAAVNKLKENINNKSQAIDASRTDVIGGLLRASRLFAETPDVTGKHLIVYSDMLDNESAGLSINRLKALGSHSVLLKKLVGQVGVPVLKDVDVDLFSVFTDIKDINTVQTESAIKELKGFWGEYLRRSGASVKSFRTSY